MSQTEPGRRGTASRAFAETPQNVSRETLEALQPAPATVGTGLKTCPLAAPTDLPGINLYSDPRTPHNVSRETFPPSAVDIHCNPIKRSPKRNAGIAAAVLGGLAMIAAACSAPAGPVGWAGPVPVKVESQKLILVAHKARLYALKDESSIAQWQFPPKDKASYPLSTQASEALTKLVDQLSVDDAAKSDLKKKVADLTVSGPGADALKKAIDASAATEAQKSATKASVDSKIANDASALNSPKALYGDIGTSTDGKTTYVPTYRGIVFALDTATGNVRWSYDVGSGIIGGVTVDGDRIYVGTKANRLFALDAKTGDKQWEFKTKGEVWASATVDSGTIYFTSLDGSLYALDASGNQKWVFNSASSGVAAKPVVANGAVYVGAFDNKLYSVKTSDGSMNWSVKADNWFWAAPVVKDGIVYAASLDGKVYAVDASTGGSKWDKPFDTGSAVRAAPVVAGRGLVVAAKNGSVYKLDLESGRSVDDTAAVVLGSNVLANMATDGDKIVYIVPSGAGLYVLDASGALAAPGSIPLPQ